jgi:hypothetical protein
MNVAHEFGEIAVSVVHNGFVPVLKKVPMPMMAQVVADSIAGQKTPPATMTLKT